MIFSRFSCQNLELHDPEGEKIARKSGYPRSLGKSAGRRPNLWAKVVGGESREKESTKMMLPLDDRGRRRILLGGPNRG